MRWHIRLVLILVSVIVIVQILIQTAGNSEFYNKGFASTPRYFYSQHVGQKLNRAYPEHSSVSSDVRVYQDGREVRHFVFLKVHKAASGTVSSMFFRFGLSRNLTFALPKYYNIIHLSDTIKEEYIYPRPSQTFDIINSHMLYDRSAVEKFVPKDAVYIGILRDPFQQFKSSLNYMQPEYIFNLSKTSPVHEFLKDPLKIERANKDSPRYSWINNRQAVEFGVPDKVIINKVQQAVKEYIQKLHKEFHLVLISEYFDESVILMRRMFNWGIKDVLYRSVHIRGWDRKTTLPMPHDRRRFQNWASVDYSLYDFFYKRLWQQIRLAGSDFFDELLYFKRIRAEVDDFCKVIPNATMVYHISPSPWNDAIKVDTEFCGLLNAEENDFVKIIAKRQYGIILRFE